MRNAPSNDINTLKLIGLQAIRELETPDGLLASGRDEAYGCIFGRDSLIAALELLRAYEREPDAYYLSLVRKVLCSLASLQGRAVNRESGEEPGKIIHEYRPERHEHLTGLATEPWFVYPEGAMRNYDSVDATPLFLIAVAQYAKYRDAGEFMPAVEAALGWLEQFDSFVSYQFHPDRKYGGLKVQSWMDSTESVFYEYDDVRPPYPIAPVEVQAYAWAALRAWGRDAQSERLKRAFSEAYLMRGPRSLTLAYALDGAGRKLTSPRSTMGHVLWAAFEGEAIIPAEAVAMLRRRLLSRDLFVPQAGIRTLSSRSLRYDPFSYHNGSIWPHDTAMLADGLENFGYHEDAARVRQALLRAYAHFQTPIELFAWKRGFKEYKHPHGGGACRVQAWSAAGLLSIITATPAAVPAPVMPEADPTSVLNGEAPTPNGGLELAC